MVLSSYWRKHLSCLISSEIPYNYYLCVRIFFVVLTSRIPSVSKTPSDTYIYIFIHTKLSRNTATTRLIEFSLLYLMLFYLNQRHDALYQHQHTWNVTTYWIPFAYFFVFLFREEKKIISNRFQNKRTREPYKMSQVVE